MKKIINLSKKHGGLVFGEVLVVAGAVVVGDYALRAVSNMNLRALFVALPLIFLGLVMRTYFNQSNKKKDIPGDIIQTS
jgi:hypothetical protein|tara:strand:- start:330 stop:566 length:237 start_codon:yes stop_codon:yes gene_type:complete